MTMNILIVILTLAPTLSDATMTLFKVERGTCMDGTPAAYYFRPSSTKSTTWQISLEGGGACYDQETCTSRSKGALGSSKNYKPTLEAEKWMSASSTANPDFYDANTVYVPYCSSDTHRGQQNTTSALTWGFYFSGHLNLVAIVNDIKQKQPEAWNNMKQMLLTGGSAGGIGTIYNADWLGTVMPPSASIKAAPLGGWFFPGNYADQVKKGRSWSPPSLFPDFANHTASDHRLQYVFINSLWKPFLSPTCIAHQKQGEEYHCSTAHVAYHFVHTPMYIMENMYDTNQISAQGGLPRNQFNSDEGKRYIQYFGIGMRNSTFVLKKGDGIFLSSCLDHTSGLHVGGSTTINGKLSGQILGDWFFDRANPSVVLRDTCDATNNDLPCNPTCDGLGPSPSGGTCGKELEKDCPTSDYPTPGKCDQCAKAHESELKQASCTVRSVVAACQGRTL
jgi:hypothetical protein